MSGTRSKLVREFLALRPMVERRFKENLQEQLRDELQHVTIHQLQVLDALRDGPLAMRELSRRLGVTESAATASADRLVRQGLVERLSEPSDRRVVLVGLSEAGTDLITTVRDASRDRTKQMLAVLSDEQLSQLVDIFQTLCSQSGEAGELHAIENGGARP